MTCIPSTCELKIKRVSPHAKIPKKAHTNDAAMDLYSVVNTIIPSGSCVVVDTGLQVETTADWKIHITPRSGLSTKGIKVANSPGLVDSCTYRGNVGVVLENLSPAPFVVNIGDRIAQMCVERVWDVNITEVDTLSDTERGSGGFGHTGIK